jgi:hypothetical protein
MPWHDGPGPAALLAPENHLGALVGSAVWLSHDLDPTWEKVACARVREVRAASE